MCRLAAVHAPPGGFWKIPENANRTRNPKPAQFDMIHDTLLKDSKIKNTE